MFYIELLTIVYSNVKFFLSFAQLLKTFYLYNSYILFICWKKDSNLVLFFIINAFIFMIKPQTYLNVADNTGAQKIMCIKILGSNNSYANIGDIIVAVVKL